MAYGANSALTFPSEKVPGDQPLEAEIQHCQFRSLPGQYSLLSTNGVYTKSCAMLSEDGKEQDRKIAAFVKFRLLEETENKQSNK